MESRQEQAQAWAGLITRCTKVAMDYDSGNPFFAATAQAVKAKLGNTEAVGGKNRINDNPGVLTALVTPFFQETSYPTAIAVEKPIEEGSRKTKPEIIYEDGPNKTAPTIYGALQELIAADPENETLVTLFDDIEAQATKLPIEVKQAVELVEMDVPPNAQATAEAPEYAS